MAKLDIQVAIPSRARTGVIDRALSMVPNALVFVAESEADEYLKAGVPKDQLRTHPGLHGLARIRNWILDHTEAEIVVQMDDDCKHIACWPGYKKRVITKPEDVWRITEQTARMAKESGTVMFGWSNHGQPRYYKPFDPISFTGPLGRVVATIGRELRWDEQLISMVDTDATLECLKRWRFVICETRYYWNCGQIYGNVGGCQEIRTTAVRARDRRIMKLKWGDAFDVDRGTASGTSTNRIRVPRRNRF